MRIASQRDSYHSKRQGSSERPNTGPYLGKSQWKAAFFGRRCRVIWQAHGAASSHIWREVCSTNFSITRLQLQQRKKKKIWNCLNATVCQVQFWSCVCTCSGKWSRGNKCSHWERSKCVNARYTSMLCAGLDRQWLFKKSLCFCVGAESAHPNSA